MKYRVMFKERYKPNQYVITKNGEIVWASESFKVWVGKKIEQMLSWLDFKDIGTWKIVGPECTPPRVVRRTYRTRDED